MTLRMLIFLRKKGKEVLDPRMLIFPPEMEGKGVLDTCMLISPKMEGKGELNPRVLHLPRYGRERRAGLNNASSSTSRREESWT